MMDFLRRLAPVADDKAQSHAWPLLPSQMAGRLPLRSAPSMQIGDDADDAGTLGEGPRQTAIPHAAASDPVTSTAVRAAAAASSLPPDAPTARGDVGESATDAVVGSRSHAVARSSDPPRAFARLPTRVSASHVGTSIRGSIDAEVERNRHATRSDARPVAEAPRPSVQVAPLSSSALAARVAPPATPAVVHVTIDRIDLRFPPATETPAPCKPVRAARPEARSLADYLGARNGDGTGAPR